jgi:hypothetical protein
MPMNTGFRDRRESVDAGGVRDAAGGGAAGAAAVGGEKDGGGNALPSPGAVIVIPQLSVSSHPMK